MAYIDTILSQRTRLIQGDSRFDGAIANVWPAHEVQTPAYPTPTAYHLGQIGLRNDELVFACIDRRATAISEPPLSVVKKAKRGRKTKREQVDSPLTQLIDRPNSEMSEARFWRAVSQSVDAFGFSVWEIELSRLGYPIALWPMQPQYVSFLRGPQDPIRAVRYEVPGLPPFDVERSRCLIFLDFDPLYPFTRGLSRTAVALKSIGVHGATGKYLKDFFERGAVPQGVLSTQQILTKAEATRQRELWEENHGGSGSWGRVAVLGGGVEYKSTEAPLKDMAFDHIDGRTEALICMTFAMSPVILGAKVGLSASTYNNFDAAIKQMYSQAIRPQWRLFADEMTAQLLPLFDDSSELVCEFDLSDVAAVSEDEDKLATRVEKLARANLMYRDEARGRIGLNEIDEGEKVFIGVSVSSGDSALSPITNLESDFDELSEDRARRREASVAALSGRPGSLALQAPNGGASGSEANGYAKEPKNDRDEQDVEAQKSELKRLRALALENVGEGVGWAHDDELLGLTTRSAVRSVFDRHWPKDQSSEISRLALAIEKAADKL
jgi:HK97 family phage portal protein